MADEAIYVSCCFYHVKCYNIKNMTMMSSKFENVSKIVKH